jgi:hypothetical protein
LACFPVRSVTSSCPTSIRSNPAEVEVPMLIYYLFFFKRLHPVNHLFFSPMFFHSFYISILLQHFIFYPLPYGFFYLYYFP